MSETQVIDAVFWSEKPSRYSVADMLGFSRSKASVVVANLLEQGLLTESGLLTSSGGRRAEGLCLGQDSGILVGIDIGATSLDIALLKLDMSIICQHSEPADVRKGPNAVLARVRSIVLDLLRRAGANRDQVLATGLGVPGPVNFASGQLVNPPLMPGWDSYSIRDYLRDTLPSPIYVDNDVNLMAMGVFWQLRRKLRNFLTIKVATGVGCGIICNGELHRGASGCAGDIGHIIVDDNGRQCTCGNRGCLEAEVGGPAIAEMAQEAAESGKSPALRAVLDRNGHIETSDLVKASRDGDAAASAIVSKAGQNVGVMLATIVNFFNPSHVFIGGRMSDFGPLFLASIRQQVNKRSLALSTRHLEITHAPLGSQSGMIGAGVLAMHEFLRRDGVN